MKVMFVSTWNTHCGIATYTKALAHHLRLAGMSIEVASELDPLQLHNLHSIDYKVFPCWTRHRKEGNLANLLEVIAASKPDVVHIQHEYGLFPNVIELGQAIHKITKLCPVFITMHTIPRNMNISRFVIPAAANKDVVYIAHSLAGAAQLNDNVLGRVLYIQHGTLIRVRQDKRTARIKMRLPQEQNIAVSVGFIVPNKNLHENIGAVCALNKQGKFSPEKLLYVIAGEASRSTQDYLADLYMQMSIYREDCCVDIRPKYLSEDEVGLYLSAADFAIQNFTQSEYSISGQSHQLLGIGTPIIARRVHMHDDLPESAVLKFDSMNELSNAVLLLTKRPDMREQLARQTQAIAQETKWEHIAQQHVNAYEQAMSTEAE